MNKLIICCFCSLIIICSCTTSTKKIEKQQQPTKADFVLKGKLTSYLSDKIYLNKIIENSITPIDSALIKNNEFVFNGAVIFPERFLLTFENYSVSTIIIVENTHFEIEIDPKNTQEPIITNSPLNNLLNEYKQNSKNIFHKLDLLFPAFQKARLQNDAKKLSEIGEKLRTIENEYRDYSYNFILENKNSYVSAMVLRDQLKLIPTDTIRIKKYYNLLSENVKKSPDAQIIALNLEN
ncbi:DUF4369 domain-containing protein [Lutibacter sp. HS1-25]|uniref:DUF4369 domain-containing protein n=1 Tax=Lutibacter sp. HS1-25 TaxID=2485000 RepID=UPI001011E46D|nr:DUF4369 domain-containing protein [Lutibacter sp. HS1-25]RXP55765.1 DUF4369 domain-containing protein [Lutibacter sp. HS1-25]